MRGDIIYERDKINRIAKEIINKPHLLEKIKFNINYRQKYKKYNFKTKNIYSECIYPIENYDLNNNIVSRSK